MALIFSVSSIVASVGVAAKTNRVVLPLPALLFLLLSYMFQQYSDLTVIGAARRRLEDLVNAEVGGKGLVYETAVAEIRQVRPLVRSVRVLQGLMGATVGGATIFACWVLFQGAAALVVVAFIVVTSLTMLSAGLSYRDMLRSYEAAQEALADQGLGDDRLVWIPSGLYARALETRGADELDRQAIVRLIEAGLRSRR
jgi:hypothetical protein